MYQPVAKGGINFVNFYMVVKSLRLAWIVRLLGESDDKWKVIPNYYFRYYGGLLFLLKCNYDVKLLKTGLPLFYRELPQYFSRSQKYSQHLSKRRTHSLEQQFNNYR